VNGSRYREITPRKIIELRRPIAQVTPESKPARGKQVEIPLRPMASKKTHTRSQNRGDFEPIALLIVANKKT